MRGDDGELTHFFAVVVDGDMAIELGFTLTRLETYSSCSLTLVGRERESAVLLLISCICAPSGSIRGVGGG